MQIELDPTEESEEEAQPHKGPCAEATVSHLASPSTGEVLKPIQDEHDDLIINTVGQLIKIHKCNSRTCSFDTCYVDPVTGEHKPLYHYQLVNWAEAFVGWFHIILHRTLFTHFVTSV